MKKVKINANAKINLTLDITGATEGYHTLNSLVASISLYDEITLIPRADGKIKLYNSGIPVDCATVDNNAFKAGMLFVKTFKTNGADIYIKKNIPIGGGLGGSSADIAGVLKGMKLLYGIPDDVTPLADKLGSDSGYMVTGGWAVLHGRGTEVTLVESPTNFYALVIRGAEMVSAKECYRRFDEIGKLRRPCTNKAVKALKAGETAAFFAALKNDLYSPALTILPELKDRINDLKQTDALASLMTGSGSAVYGLYLNKRDRDRAYKKLFGKYGERLIKTETVNS